MRRSVQHSIYPTRCNEINVVSANGKVQRRRAEISRRVVALMELLSEGAVNIV